MVNWNPLDENGYFRGAHTISTNDIVINGSTVQLTVAEKDSRHTLVNNPPHYNKHPSGIECIQVTRHMNFNLGNAIKYIWRADLKNDAIEDLKKAAWYIQDEIQRREKQEK